jgi:hypothetical protein
MRVCKLLIAVAGASLLMGALVATASARNISTSSQTVRASFREVRFEAPFGNTICQLTLEGSMHARTIAKVASSLTGYITSARLGPCPTGTASILAETLPWHIQYSGFTGTLPNITSVTHNFIGVSFRIREVFGVTCLARSTAANPIRGTMRISAGVISGARIGGTVPTGAECFNAAGTFSSDEGRVTVLNGTAAITVRLI